MRDSGLYNMIRDFVIKKSEKTLVFVVPSIIQGGVQNVVAPFPYAGTITEIKAVSYNAGTTPMTVQIEKSSDQNTWVGVMSTPITIAANAKKDNGTQVLTNIAVAKGDCFRLNITALNEITSITVYVKIRI